MPRLSLEQRAARLASQLAGRDLRDVEYLPNYLQVGLRRFTNAIGVNFEQFIGYAPSTQKRYIRAARKGRTAQQERERVREQRKERERKKQRPPAPGPDNRVNEIWRIRDWLLARGLDTTKGANTHTDNLDIDVLLSDEGITEHMQTYGINYVLRNLKRMQDQLLDPSIGNANWRVFKASNAYDDRSQDERWWWYHTSPRQYNSVEEAMRALGDFYTK